MSVSTIYMAGNAFAITKSDSVIQPFYGFYVGAAGDVAVMPYEQENASTPTAVTLKAVPVGTYIPLRCSRLMSTNTTATLVIGFSQ